ncbi:MAG: phenylalanine--tRNA ligase subunit beta [Candidatus Nezhaarchaeota archaeon]|nr:phenylalanine--tRNA ligase subunit beta [Candidatus Nezhaarchaeota archaeon]
MPTIIVNKRDLMKLIGVRDINDDELVNALELIKAEVKAVEVESIVLEVTSDRPDMFSAEGIARALKGFLEVEVGLPHYNVEKAEGNNSVHVYEEVLNVRPCIACAAVKGCSFGDEELRQLIQLQEALHRTYGRNRKKLAIGLHNLDVVEPPISYTAKPLDSFFFIPLDESKEVTGREVLEKHPKGKEYGWIIRETGKAPLLFDSKGDILSMPPIINSNLTKLTSNTRNILIDVTGTDLNAVRSALTILAANLAERGGKIVQFLVFDHLGKRLEPSMNVKAMKVSYEKLVKVTGIQAPIEEVVHCLRRARLDAKAIGGYFEVLIPPYRVDVLDEVDIAEEYAIGYGYHRIAPLTPPADTQGEELRITSFTRLCRELMVGYGFQEVLTYMFANDDELRLASSTNGWVRVAKPISSEYTCLRTSLIPSLLRFLGENTHIEYPQKVFEVGDVITPDKDSDVKSSSRRMLAALYADHKVGYEDVQAVLYSLLRLLNLEFEVKGCDIKPMIRGRCGSLFVEGVNVGFLGEVEPEVLLRFGLQVPVAAFEVDISRIFTVRSTSINRRPSRD